MEQEKIDVTRATPVSDAPAAPKVKRRGAPMWLQILLSLIVIAAAVGITAFFNTTANTMLANYGIALPQFNAPAADASGQGGAQAQTQNQGQQQAQGQNGGQRQGGGQGGFGGGQGRGGFGNRTAVVVSEPVTTGTINNKLSAIGESSAIHSVTVTFPSSGTLMSVDVKPGTLVNAGAKLASLDSGTQQIAYDRANLALQDANATVVRDQSLVKSNALSDSQLVAAQLAADQAKLALNDAKLALDQRTIYAPVSGSVGLIQVNVGNQITAQSIVTTIEDSSEILINFWVPERYSSQIGIGNPVTAESAALPGRSFTGKISAVDNKIDPDSRTLQVQAELPNGDGTIKSGMSFSVDMAFPGQTFPAVDPLSIQWSNQGAYVWKIADGTVHKGMVEIIQRNSDGVLVQGDVKVGDAVVTQGVLQLSDGAAVRLLDANPAGDAGGGQAQAAQTQGGQNASASAPTDQNQGQAGQGQGGYKKRQASSAPATGG